MILTSKMVLLSAVILEKYFDAITKQLLKLGQLDFISIKELTPEFSSSLRSLEQDFSPGKINDILRKIEGYILGAGLKLPEITVKENVVFDKNIFKNAENTIEEIDVIIETIKLKQKNNQRDILRLKEVQKQLESRDNRQYLEVRSGFLDETLDVILDKLRDYNAVVLNTTEDKHYIVVNLKRDSEKIEEILKDYNWNKVSKTATDDYIKIKVKIDRKIDHLKIVQKELTGKLKDKIKIYENKLFDLWKKVKISQSFFSIQNNFNKTEKTYIFSGWIPFKSKKLVEKTVLDICQNDCYIEWTSAEEAQKEGLQPPVELTTPKFLQPFKQVIVNYEIPEYGTINPTYITAITFLVMFGMMFGDVGHGLVILLVGIIGSIYQKVNHKNNSLMNMFIYCGLSAMFFGVLFGSYFGWSLLPALWFNYHGAVTGEHVSGTVTSIMNILAITTWFGVFIITLGMVFYWYNCIAKKRWLNLIADKNGISGAVLYLTGVYCAYVYMTTNSFSSINFKIVTPLFVVPAFMFFVKLAIEAKNHSISGKFSIKSLPLIIMEWFVEILEVFSGYLANTLSFLRVAGLGIAHVSLMGAFFYMANMFGTGTFLNSIGYIVMLILGNILVIGLEGLSAGIQTLRLHYYEFFGKFLIGGGKIYNPIKLK